MSKVEKDTFNAFAKQVNASVKVEELEFRVDEKIQQLHNKLRSYTTLDHLKESLSPLVTKDELMNEFDFQNSRLEETLR